MLATGQLSDSSPTNAVVGKTREPTKNIRLGGRRPPPSPGQHGTGRTTGRTAGCAGQDGRTEVQAGRDGWTEYSVHFCWDIEIQCTVPWGHGNTV